MCIRDRVLGEDTVSKELEPSIEMINEILQEFKEHLSLIHILQELRKNKRRPTRTGKTNMFSGIARCADCGEQLYYCTSKNFEACLLYTSRCV